MKKLFILLAIFVGSSIWWSQSTAFADSITQNSILSSSTALSESDTPSHSVYSSISPSGNIQYTIGYFDGAENSFYNSIIANQNFDITTTHVSTASVNALKNLTTFLGYPVTSIDTSTANHIIIKFNNTSKVNSDMSITIESSYSNTNDTVLWDNNVSLSSVHVQTKASETNVSEYNMNSLKRISEMSLDATGLTTNTDDFTVSMDTFLGNMGDEVHSEILINNIGGATKNFLDSHQPSYSGYSFLSYQPVTYVVNSDNTVTLSPLTTEQVKQYYNHEYDRGDSAILFLRLYTKDPVAGKDVTVNYVDEDGNQVHASQTLSGNIGENFDASSDTYKLAISGYTLDTAKLPTNASGTFSDQEQTVTYVYKKNPVITGTVTINYLDESGKQIHAPQTLTGTVNENYDASTNVYKLTIDGYILDNSKLPTNAVGTFSEKDQTVTYIYDTDSTDSSSTDSSSTDSSSTTSTSTDVKQSKDTLPQTGEKQTVWLSAVGILLLIMGSVFLSKRSKAK